MPQSTTPDQLLDKQFPPGTPVCVMQSIDHRTAPIQIEVVGVVESWQSAPTGSWHAHGKDHKLWLTRLALRKPDGEQVDLVIDKSTTVARLAARST